VATLAQGVAGGKGFAALVSVGLTATSGVAYAAAFTAQEGSALAAMRVLPVLECAPSAWAAEPAPGAAAKACARGAHTGARAPPAARADAPARSSQLPKSSAELVEGAGVDGEWLYCTHRGKSRSKKRPIYQWTGKLRPQPVSPYRPVPDHIPRPDYAITGWPAEEMESKLQNVVHLHTPEQIAGIRAACQLVRAPGAASLRAAQALTARAAASLRRAGAESAGRMCGGSAPWRDYG
jgi:hypothetical protein